MPQTSTLLWVLTVGLVIAFPIIADNYFTAMAMAGAYPPDGDTIIMPIMGSVFLAIALSPFIIGCAWLALRRYEAAPSLMVWRDDRRLRSVFITLAALIGLSGALFLSVVYVLQIRIWQELLWTVYYLGWAYWFAAMRAAFIDQPTKREFLFD